MEREREREGGRVIKKKRKQYSIILRSDLKESKNRRELKRK